MIEELLKDPQKREKFCRQYFDSIDKNRNGVLEYKEIKVILSKFADESNSIQSPEDEIIDAFNKLDGNKDGKISFSEFQMLFDKYLKGLSKNK